MVKRALLALSLGIMATASHAEVLLSEGFNDISQLTANGWSLLNNSSPANGTNWGQGSSIDFFAAQAGGANSYISADYHVAQAGGVIDDWLITPTFSTAKDTLITFYARADMQEGFQDSIAFGVNTTGGTTFGDFQMLKPVTLSGDWVQYTFSLGAQGAGSTARFGIQYTGAADTANYIGIDSLNVNAVPEPATYLMAGIGLLALGLVRRRATRRAGAVLALAASAALPAMAQDAAASTDVAISTDSQVVVRDASSGKLRAATPQETQALLKAAPHANALRAGARAKPMQIRHWTGARGVRLTDDFLSHSIVVKQPDGSLAEACIEGKADAEAAVRAAAQHHETRTEQRNELPTE